jgi:glycosyltransferase involved in cell wall biosynthesis
MRITFVNQYYPPDMAPTGMVLRDLAVRLARRGHEVTVVCSCRSYEGRERYGLHEEHEGVRIERVRGSGFGRGHVVGRLLDYASYYLALAVRLVSLRPRPDLIVAMTTPPYVGVLARVAAWLWRCPHAHWIMDLYPDAMVAHGMVRPGGMAHRILEMLATFQLGGSALVLCLGPEMESRASRYCSEGAGAGALLKWLPLWSPSSIHSPDPAAVASLRRERGWTDDEVVLMYSGNMGLGHRFGEFLEAAQSPGRHPGVRWVFAGGGRRRGRIESFMRDHPSARIALLPYVPEEKLSEHLGSADVLLASLNSDWEGCILPSKIQSILTVGRPVIFVGRKDSSMALWLREARAGWVVDENDGRALAVAIDEARNPAERARRASAGKALAERLFSVDVNCELICDWMEACGRSELLEGRLESAAEGEAGT